MALRLEADARGGDQVLVAEKVSVGCHRRAGAAGARLLGHVRRGDVVGFVGPNGAGKTTLLRRIVGERPPEGGEVRIPESVQIAHYRQDLAQVPADRSLYDLINDLRPTGAGAPSRVTSAASAFRGDTVLRQAATLSGGERARVALAMMMLSGANLLLFDEPTNHLDVESIEALEDAIEAYEGTVILVSHDRALLRALTTRVWVLHEGRITDYPGGFEEWETASAERAHAASVAAREEESLRRVHERKQTRRSEDSRKHEVSSKRDSRKALEEAEARVSVCEERVASIRARLEDPALYTTRDGVLEAQQLGRELEIARAELDSGLQGVGRGGLPRTKKKTWPQINADNADGSG